MLADRTKTRGYLSTAKQKQTRPSVYEFPIKGGVIKRKLRRPTPKISFKIARPLVEWALRAFIRLEIKDRENLPDEGAFIAVFNHLNLIDPPLHIISILPRDSIIMAKEELFFYWPIPLFRILMDIAEAYPVRRRGTAEERRKAIKYAEEVLANGLVFGIYPEGTRSKLGFLKEAYTGCALIAVDTGVPLIPVSIQGTEKLKGMGWLARPKVTITFGKPFTLPPIQGRRTEQKLKELTDYIMSKLAGMLPPEYRGRYPPC
ncbi:MAG: 1-acyl-sn-glycerol-3-phosphate acyltransferase [Dehalococcoidia bacterium]|nr:1-acyl-sn-glycerol-3-phosphate acyltransferase [Dehalococcoidia bacterium]